MRRPVVRSSASGSPRPFHSLARVPSPTGHGDRAWPAGRCNLPVFPWRPSTRLPFHSAAPRARFRAEPIIRGVCTKHFCFVAALPPSVTTMLSARAVPSYTLEAGAVPPAPCRVPSVSHHDALGESGAELRARGATRRVHSCRAEAALVASAAFHPSVTTMLPASGAEPCCSRRDAPPSFRPSVRVRVYLSRPSVRPWSAVLRA